MAGEAHHMHHQDHNGGRKVGGKVGRKVTEWRQKVAEKVAEFPHLAGDSATGESKASVAHLHLFTAHVGACSIEPHRRQTVRPLLCIDTTHVFSSSGMGERMRRHSRLHVQKCMQQLEEGHGIGGGAGAT